MKISYNIMLACVNCFNRYTSSWLIFVKLEDLGHIRLTALLLMPRFLVLIAIKHRRISPPTEMHKLRITVVLKKQSFRKAYKLCTSKNCSLRYKSMIIARSSPWTGRNGWLFPKTGLSGSSIQILRNINVVYYKSFLPEFCNTFYL